MLNRLGTIMRHLARYWHRYVVLYLVGRLLIELLLAWSAGMTLVYLYMGGWALTIIVALLFWNWSRDVLTQLQAMMVMVQLRRMFSYRH